MLPSALPIKSSEPSVRNARWAFERYEQVRHRLPAPEQFPAASSCQYHQSLADVFKYFDAFVLDGFGVLNVGEAPVLSAATRLAQMKAAGKQVMVITNGASTPSSATAEKYQGWKLGLSAAQVISSRDALADALAQYPGHMRWGFAATEGSAIESLVNHAVLLGDDEQSWQEIDGFVLLSSLTWSATRQDRLLEALAARQRPLLVGNPDLVAPREDGLSLEPGFYAHEAADLTGVVPLFFGKPCAEVFAMCQARLDAMAGRPVAGARIAMVGDSLHTDILGAAAYGWGSVLVASHGLFRDESIPALIETSGITPEHCVLIT